MIPKKLFSFSLLFFLLFKLPLFSQNLLNVSSWTVGSGSVTGFNQYGLTPKNVRLMGNNHIGQNVVLWRATPDSNGTASGGWDTPYINIVNTRNYRLSVWIKKTNSNGGTTFFGPYSNSSDADHILNLNGTLNTSPYFWNGDLPILDRWYLLVGYVNKSSYTSTLSYGGIYDGVTGEKIINITDFKFKTTATVISHRAYLWDDRNPSDRQYYSAPRLDWINGLEPSINQLLNINDQSKLLFAFDNAGNQKQRFYCPLTGCTIPTPPAGRSSSEEIEPEEVVENELEEKLVLYPNPSEGIVILKFDSNSGISLLNDINIYNSIGVLVHTIPIESKNETELNLTNLPTGMYLIHVHLTDGTQITKQIIKN